MLLFCRHCYCCCCCCLGIKFLCVRSACILVRATRHLTTQASKGRERAFNGPASNLSEFCRNDVDDDRPPPPCLWRASHETCVLCPPITERIRRLDSKEFIRLMGVFIGLSRLNWHPFKNSRARAHRIASHDATLLVFALLTHSCTRGGN